MAKSQRPKAKVQSLPLQHLHDLTVGLANDVDSTAELLLANTAHGEDGSLGVCRNFGYGFDAFSAFVHVVFAILDDNAVRRIEDRMLVCGMELYS